MQNALSEARRVPIGRVVRLRAVPERVVALGATERLHALRLALRDVPRLRRRGVGAQEHGPLGQYGRAAG